ncbi:MAG: alpha/beta hydrolase [Methanomassiliicoccaceae archaeon]|nr:alpha/beta hydrolase [Methanomassiliicoccaceae archaeon]
MPIADINGQRINYEVVGSGTPVILITGFGGDITFWNNLVPLLSSNYRLIMIDNRGAGRTEYNGRFTTDDMTDDVVSLMDHLSVYKAHVVGWSMGGCMAQELSLAHPQRVISLTLISAYMRRPARSSHMMNTMIRAVREGADIDVLSMALQGMCLPESAFQRREEKGTVRGKRPFTSTIDGIEDQMRSVDAYDSRKRISAIAVPTLCIHGLSDIMVPPEIGDEITSLIRGCKPYRIPGAGHVIDPASYHKRMVEHFKENE